MRVSALRACLATLFAGALAALRFGGSGDAAAIGLAVAPIEILADGYDSAVVRIQSSTAPALSVETKHSGVAVGSVTRAADGRWEARIRAGVVPGAISIRATAEGAPPTNATLRLLPSLIDREGDGMPDAVQLDRVEDRAAFRRWFTFLAEAQFYQSESSRLAEINDCAALIRYAYREALRAHDSAWASASRLPLLIGLSSVEKYEYPYTLLRASLFRVKPGPLQPGDLENGSFAQFADAKTLQKLNTHFVSRDLAHAEPGDLLFFRHDSADMPFHTMLYLGKSQIHEDGQRYLLYHTGPDGADPGEIRKPSIQELTSHPNPGWRPVAGNPTFLGVYRWNILR